MMKKIIILLLTLALLAACFAGCDGQAGQQATEGAATVTPENAIDYVAQLKLDPDSETAKEYDVKIKQFVDGDTTHFYVSASAIPGGVLKARYLAINTPESTGKIEEYGKKAASFTKEKLSNAESIVLESDTASWDTDSTGGRYTTWVWYKPKGSDTYRNLNVEILQEGLAIASNTGGNRYGEIATAALDQAKALKLNVHSGEKDPDFYYGEAVELDLKELRTNIEEYANIKVAFNGIVTMHNANTAYVEAYDAETDMYYGMSVYYGYNSYEQLAVGNEVRVVGTAQYYEAGGTWQVSGVQYRLARPDDPANLQIVSRGHEASFRLTDPQQFINGKVTVGEGEEAREIPYAQLVMSTTVEMKGLKVVDSYTTSNEDSASKGAFTLTCKADGVTVKVRTVVLGDENGELLKAQDFIGKTINVKGIVDYFSGDYQIKVLDANDITLSS